MGTNEVLKAVVAQFDAGELITQREMLSARVRSDLVARAEQFGLILDDIAITHLTFGREFTQAVELKQVAQQEAEKAKFLVERAEQIKQASIISAEGDSGCRVAGISFPEGWRWFDRTEKDRDCGGGGWEHVRLQECHLSSSRPEHSHLSASIIILITTTPSPRFARG